MRPSLRVLVIVLAVVLNVPIATPALAHHTPSHCAAAHDCKGDALVPQGRPGRFTLDVRGATIDADDPSGCVAFETVWAKFTADQDGTAHVAQVAGTSFNPAVGVYRDIPGFPRLACGATTSDRFLDVSFPCVAGATYYIQVGRGNLQGTPNPVTLELDGCGANGILPQTRGDYTDLAWTVNNLGLKSSGRLVLDRDPTNENTEHRTVILRTQLIASPGSLRSVDTGERGIVVVAPKPKPPGGVGPNGLPTLDELVEEGQAQRGWVERIRIHVP